MFIKEEYKEIDEKIVKNYKSDFAKVAEEIAEDCLRKIEELRKKNELFSYVANRVKEIEKIAPIIKTKEQDVIYIDFDKKDIKDYQKVIKILKRNEVIENEVLRLIKNNERI